MRAPVIATILFAPTCACALDIGALLPMDYGETIVVKNDGGIKNWTDHFPYGSTCHADLNLKIWLLVRRIVGDNVLAEVDLPRIETTQQSCPHGTETSMPLAQAQKRYDDYVRATDREVFLPPLAK